MPANPTSDTEITLSFSPSELSQLEAFASLHGEPVAAFIQNAALEAANVTSTKKKSAKGNQSDTGSLWLTDGFSDAPETQDEKAPDLFAPVDLKKEPESAAVVLTAVAPATELKPKRGVAGERSKLAKGHGPVWEVRRALGRERVHGLGWTREQLAFVLKLSVVGVRKMEHLGTSPIKSLEARQKLLGLAKTLEDPTPEIVAYIEREEVALG